jgi:glucuronoarabinoxylan endo-1,4-beta-xylanase
MHHRYVSFCLALLTGLTVNAQTINLRGVVSNSTNQPVAGAIVSVVAQKLKDTTDADGKYSFSGGVAVQLPAVTPKANTISMENGVLRFSVSNTSPVKIEIFDIKGNLLKKEIMSNIFAGEYHFSIANNQFAQKHLIVKASIGPQEMSFSYVNIGSCNVALKSSDKFTTLQTGGKLAKIAAVVDTLKVTATGYAPQSIPLASLNQELNVTLSGENEVVVRLDQTKQLIRGFGINNTWGSIGNAIPKCFDSTTGLGLNVLRIGMQPNADNVSAYENFNDVKAAANLGCKYIIGTVWSAPAKFKTNNNLNAGGYLKEEYYQDWAKAIAKFPKVVKDGSGIDLYAMSPQNETDFASCASKGEPCTVDYVTMLWTGQMYAKFFEIVGPLIKAAGCKAMAPEASEWLHAWSDFSACCSEPSGKGSSDPLGCGYLGKDGKPLCDHAKGYDYGHWLYANKKAWDAIDIFSTHQYDTQVAEPWPSDVPRTNAIGTIEVWQTEMSGVRYWPEQGELSGNSCTCTSHIKNGVAVARWIHSALTVGEASTWCYWWWKQSGDNEGITCDGTTLTKRYYTIGNFSRYMRPGQHVVTVTGTKSLPAKVLLVASKGDNGKVVIVAINETTSAQSVPITIAGGTAPGAFTPIVTADGNDNWSTKSDVSVSGGKFTASLPAMSVTTFVSK